MKKLLAIILAAVMIPAMVGCISIETTDTDNTNMINESPVLLFDQENVKISYTGIGSDAGVGESMILKIENSRSESIIVQIAEVSFNGVMQAVIQPQMPLHITSPSKTSNLPYTFSGTKIEGGSAQFKIKILDENFKTILTSDFVEVSF